MSEHDILTKLQAVAERCDGYDHTIILKAISEIERLRGNAAVTAERDALLADKQITFRDLMAIQAYEVVATEEDGTIAQAAKDLGIETSKYDCDKHWNKLVALRCYKVADAFLEVRAIDAAKGGAA